MEIHIQKCQKCGSNNLKNILARETGEPEKVFVQCHDCEEFVARYTIAPLGYYHHGKGFDSFLRSFNRSAEFMSGRRIQQMFERNKSEGLENYEAVLKYLEERDKNK